MRINDRSKTDFDRAKIKLTGHFDRRPTGRYFEPCKNKNFKEFSYNFQRNVLSETHLDKYDIEHNLHKALEGSYTY